MAHFARFAQLPSVALFASFKLLIMRVSIATRDYSQTAILAAVKKQQVFADWRIAERGSDSTVIMFDKPSSSLMEEECVQRFRQQLDDEMLREKLESDFGNVRDMLVGAALSPIIGKNEC